MSETAAKLLEQIRALPPEEQRFIAEQLGAGSEEDAFDDPEYCDEIERRSDAVADGAAEVKDWDEARAEIRAELERRAALRQNAGGVP